MFPKTRNHTLRTYNVQCCFMYLDRATVWDWWAREASTTPRCRFSQSHHDKLTNINIVCVLDLFCVLSGIRQIINMSLMCCSWDERLCRIRRRLRRLQRPVLFSRSQHKKLTHATQNVFPNRTEFPDRHACVSKRTLGLGRLQVPHLVLCWGRFTTT